jgi:hypothetical protein
VGGVCWSGADRDRTGADRILARTVRGHGGAESVDTRS